MSAPAPPQPTRATVTTIRADGSRQFLYPADVRGRFSRARRLVAGVFIALYLSLPWIRIGGYPAVFLDVAHRRFHLLGRVFAAQDLWLIFFLISGVGFGLFFVTAMLGRIWCGWACPQTVFLDHVYRRWERWLDGDGVQRRELAAAPWSAGKVGRRAAKHAGYLLISAVLTHLFLAYYVSLPVVWSLVRAAPGAHWSIFVFIALATGALYFNFAWFREQLCIVICPYGRLQSVLTDEHTLTIGYDTARGDCIDCLRCVRVCPTGIDIRQGLQMECIGCAACVDACDEVMDRLARPRGLVRYDSLAGLGGQPTRWIRPRVWLYAGLLAAGATAAALAFATVRPAVLSVSRMIGAPYYFDRDSVRNQILVRVINKRPDPVRFTLTVSGLPPGFVVGGNDHPLELGPLQEDVRLLVISEPRAHFASGAVLVIGADDDRGDHLSRPISFLGPGTALP